MLPRVEAHLAALRADDAAAVRKWAGDALDLDPQLAARAQHRTAYRGLQVLAVYVQARRRLLFDRFCDFWAEQERVGTWERWSTRSVGTFASPGSAARRPSEQRRRAASSRPRSAQEREAASRAASAAAAELQAARRVAGSVAASHRSAAEHG